MSKRALLIACGPSAVKAKELLKEHHYDLVVGVNHACLGYPVDTNVMLESKPWDLIKLINKAFRKHQRKFSLVMVKRATQMLDPLINTHLVTMCNFKAGEKEPDMRSIDDGILNTYLTKESVGTSVGALHYICSRGATHIDVVGCEYSWWPKLEPNHFYGDDYQFIKMREGDQAELDLPDGRRTKVLYLRTAKNFGALVNNHLTPLGITITDHSGGILKDYINGN